MTKTEACRRVALVTLVAGMIVAAHEAGAKITVNGVDSNGIAGDGPTMQGRGDPPGQGLGPHDVGPAAAPAPARAADPDRLRLRAVRPAGE